MISLKSSRPPKGLKSSMIRLYSKYFYYNMPFYSNSQMLVLIILAFFFLFMVDMKITDIERKNAELMELDDMSDGVMEEGIMTEESLLEFEEELAESEENFKKDLPHGKKDLFKSQVGNAKFEEQVRPQQEVRRSDLEGWRGKMHQDAECSTISITYGKPEELPVVLLASHEGAGVDWARKVLEVTSGFYTGFEDKQKMADMSLGLGSGFDIFDKARDDSNHDLDDGTLVASQTFRGFDKFHSTAILLLRNPFESLVSAKAESDGNLDASVLSGPVWETEMRQKTYAWLARSKTWICSAQSLLVTHYELLRKDLRKEFTSMLEFLALTVDEKRLSCATNFGMTDIDPIEKVASKLEAEKLKFPFGSTQVKSLELAICNVNWLLLSKGYDPLPLDIYLSRLERLFEGPFIPKTLCEQKSQHLEPITC